MQTPCQLQVRCSLYVKGSEADKAAAADAYRLYDSLGNLFTRGESIGGQIDGIKDYIFAAAADPSNYLGLSLVV